MRVHSVSSTMGENRHMPDSTIINRGIKKSQEKKKEAFRGGEKTGHTQRIKNQIGFYLLKNETESQS